MKDMKKKELRKQLEEANWRIHQLNNTINWFLETPNGNYEIFVREEQYPLFRGEGARIFITDGKQMYFLPIKDKCDG